MGKIFIRVLLYIDEAIHFLILHLSLRQYNHTKIQSDKIGTENILINIYDKTLIVNSNVCAMYVLLLLAGLTLIWL